MLHTLTCPTIRGEGMCSTGDVLRVVRARNVAEAVLDLIEAYMIDDVRRKVSVCSCASSGMQPSRPERKRSGSRLWQAFQRRQ
jgi:hypothetical protein